MSSPSDGAGAGTVQDLLHSTEQLLALPSDEAELMALDEEELRQQIHQYQDLMSRMASHLHASTRAPEPSLAQRPCGTMPMQPQSNPGQPPLLEPEQRDAAVVMLQPSQPGHEGQQPAALSLPAIPLHSEPIEADIRTFDWPSFYQSRQFDVVMMDPPWQLASANPTRGVSLGYSQLSDADIAALPIPSLQQQGGLLFVWVINSKFSFVLSLFEAWGYSLVDEVVWVKLTVNRRLAKSHGYYLQHAKEVCLVGRRKVKGCRGHPALRAVRKAGGVGSDVILSERRGQSQKPEEIYDLIENLVPKGRYLEIFARRNNLRPRWVSMGNEVMGTAPRAQPPQPSQPPPQPRPDGTRQELGQRDQQYEQQPQQQQEGGEAAGMEGLQHAGEAAAAEQMVGLAGGTMTEEA